MEPADDLAARCQDLAAESLYADAIGIGGGNGGAGVQRQARLCAQACTKLAAGDLAVADPRGGPTDCRRYQAQARAIADDTTIGNGCITVGQLNAIACT
ncbi:hypothetical protein D3C76_1321030 [compost metagenome]